MNTKQTAATWGTMILASLASGVPISDALAQQPIANAPGAPVAGICTYSAQVVLTTSTAGAAATQRLTQLSQSNASQLQPTGAQIDADNKALVAQKASLPAATFDQRVAALQQRARDFNALVQTRNAQLERTRDGAINRISLATVPLLNAAIAAHRCSIVIDKGSTYSVNPAMDLTPEITQKLNATLPSITFELAAPPAAK